MSFINFLEPRMTELKIEDVQQILKLEVPPYPGFADWREELVFVVDGTTVKAKVLHAWRYITIQIIEPFYIEAWAFHPPLIALGVSMLHRKASLEKQGITETEDCLRRAKSAFLRHLAYLKLKPDIELAQQEFSTIFKDELESLVLEFESVRAHVDTEKRIESHKFRSGERTQKEHQAILKRLQIEASDAYSPYSNLKFQVDQELSDIKQLMMDKILDNDIQQ
jgi:hypothetical protein